MGMGMGMGSNHFLSCFFMLCLFSQVGLLSKGVSGFACNWGLQSTHPLPPKIVVKLMKENGFNKVKLFEADPAALKALGKSGIQVMVGIPNDLLAPLSSSVQNAVNWVNQNVSKYISQKGVDIRYIAVGNEPFLTSYGDEFLKTTLPALENIQAALIKAGLGRQVKATVPLNADVYQSDSGLPSGGDFRADIHDLMKKVVKFLNDNGAPIMINIYPFLSLQADPDFPKDFAFFKGSAAPVVDGRISYTNVFDANFDTLISALDKNGFSSMPVVVGEVGWPTDGDPNANIANARRFNQGLVDKIIRGQGTPKRRTLPDIYIFGLIDEDKKSVDPGNFERHWGIFNYDGSIKYPLNLGKGKKLVPAKGVKYLKRQWCVLSPQADANDPKVANSVGYACSHADCTSLGNGSSCGRLDAKSNVSYAFNSYFQTMDQRKDACSFNNLAVTTNIDPSQGSCRFGVMIDLHDQKSSASSLGYGRKSLSSVVMGLFMLVLGWIVCHVY